MYIKNNNFYFNSRNYIRFNNMKFFVTNNSGPKNTGKIVNDQYMDLVIVPSLCFNNNISSYELYMTIIYEKKSNPNSHANFLIIKNKQTSKISLLYNLRNIVAIIHDVIMFYRQYKDIIKLADKLSIQMYFTNKLFNFIALRDSVVWLYINVNKPIKHDNVVLSIRNSDINDTLFNKIIVKNNVINTLYEKIIYPESYNISLDKTTLYTFNFTSISCDNYIKKLSTFYHIDYCTPFSLLIKFIDNVELFDNINDVCINSEYDLLKYL